LLTQGKGSQSKVADVGGSRAEPSNEEKKKREIVRRNTGEGIL